MRRSHPSFISHACAAACAVLLAGTAAQVQAQPPWTVEWMMEVPVTEAILSGLIDPNTGNVHVVFDVPEGSGGSCLYDGISKAYGPNGLPLSLLGTPCIDGGSTLDTYLSSVMRMGYGHTHVLNVNSVGNPNHSHIAFISSAAFGTIQSLNMDPPNDGYARATCVFADGGTMYVGGYDVDCPPLPGTVYKLGGTYWRACLPNFINSFEATEDSILAIKYPAVYTLNKASGAVGSSFDLFTGAANGTGKSHLDGDSLYWACVVGGFTQVGKYVLGQGSEWTVTLPFNQAPAGLELDAYGRLWTSAGNNLIWVNATDGGYGSAAHIAVIRTMDMWAGALLLTGRLSNDLSYILKATLTP